MNLKQFKYILTLARTGSFSKTAEILNVSQPSISQYVKYLEKELSVTLFDRSGSELKVTDAGRAYIDAGKKILDIEHQLYSQFSDIENCNSGEIRIGVSLYRGTCFAPPVLSTFKAKYPGIKVIVDELLESDLVENAELGDYDLFLTTLPIQNSIFEYKHVVEEKLVFCSSTPFSSPTINLSDLSSLPFITLESNQLIQLQFDAACEKSGVKVDKKIECRNIITQLEMVRAGLGYAIVPSSLSTSINGLYFYPLNEDICLRKVVVAYGKKQYLSEAAKYLITLFEEEFKS